MLLIWQLFENNEFGVLPRKIQPFSFFLSTISIWLAHRPGSQPPPPAPGQPLFVNRNGYTYNNGYQPQAGYYGVSGQPFYSPPPPGVYPAYPPPGIVLTVLLLPVHAVVNY